MFHNNKLVQIIATFSGALATFTTGQLMGWASPSIPILMSPELSPIGPVTSAQASWIASLVMVGNIVAIPLVAFTVDIIGRKTAILISTLPVLLSWLMVSFTTSTEMLYAARFIGGVGETYGKATMFMYVGEIAHASIRGALGTFLAITLNAGIFFEYAIGPFVRFRLLALVSALIPLTLLFTFMCMPESPYYLMLRGRHTKAETALRRLRRSQHVDDELDEIRTTVEQRLTYRESIRLLFTVRTNRNSLLLMCTLFMSQELSGITPNIMYAKKILEETHIGSLPPELAPILIPLIKIVSTLITMMLVDRTGRKPLYMISCSTCTVAMGVLSGYFYMKQTGAYNVAQYDWVPLLMMSVFNFMFIFGLGCLPFIMIGEVFPTNIKAVAVCITAVCGPLSAVVATKMFQIMCDSYGSWSAFALFAVLCAASFVFVTCCLPETKNRTLAEIQQILKK